MKTYSMFRVALVILLSVIQCHADCTVKWKKVSGGCSFQVECVRAIKKFNLPEECKASANVEVTLKDAAEMLSDDDIDKNSLETITTLNVKSKWPNLPLSLLQHTPKLRFLNLSNNEVDDIPDKPFYYLNHLEIIDLSHNFVADIDKIFKFNNTDNELKTLNLSHNEIDTINGSSFSELTSLIQLDLSNNFIEDISKELFHNLRNLEILKLDSNNIKHLNEALNNLKNLKHLYLKSNKLESVDVATLNVTDHLETFDISNNSLQMLIPNVFIRHWTHFYKNPKCKILLSQNLISTVPNVSLPEISERFKRNKKDNFKDAANVVTELDLSSNNIENIEYNAFEDIHKLISLDLSSNKLTIFKINPKHMIDIKYLNLSNNNISIILLETFASMDQLKNLDVSHNSLSDITYDTFKNNVHLKYVNLAFNHIKELTSVRIIVVHSNGGYLDLSNNELTTIEIPNYQDLRLPSLNLQSNNITDLSNVYLNSQTHLQYIDVSHNYIKYLNETCIHLPNSLITLDLRYNQVGSISPSTFHHLEKLVNLNLSHNRLLALSYGTFQGLRLLKYLDISYNNIEYLSANVLSELKSLSYLSVMFNGMVSIDYENWIGSKHVVKVLIDGNYFSCDWVNRALRDFNRGYSKMNIVAQSNKKSGNSVDGIPCDSQIDLPSEVVEIINKGHVSRKSGNILDINTELYDTRTVLVDERLLVINKKILEAIKEQTSIFSKFYIQMLKKK